ncbi:MAG: hypothetical protein QOH96_3708 [Blastocatellia bacterium]|jgi:DNA-binding response OmpR family regulator|nr:hypothetical protein [Blastocatellia bacterium]
MQLNKRRVLYVEDHEDTRELITIVLRQRDFEVANAHTVDLGVRLASEERFDLYLLDSWLPDGSGLDLCRRIRKFDQVTPILFYSAAAYEADKNMALGAGAQAYLIKPSQTSELCDLVSSLIDKANQNASMGFSS